MSEETGHSAPKLLDRVSTALRTRHYSRRTEEAYVGWTRRFILFHRKRHPNDMGHVEVAAFLSHLAVIGRVSASTQNQALCALLFLYKDVLQKPIGHLEGLVHAKRPVRLPVVLTRDEVRAVLAELHRGRGPIVGRAIPGGRQDRHHRRLQGCVVRRLRSAEDDRAAGLWLALRAAIAAIRSGGKSFCRCDSPEFDAPGPGNWCRRQFPGNPRIGGRCHSNGRVVQAVAACGVPIVSSRGGASRVFDPSRTTTRRSRPSAGNATTP